MKTIASLALMLSFGAALAAQDATKDRVERPVRDAAASPAPGKFDLSKTGIEWHKGLDAVLGKDKPILLLQLLGNFDDVYC